MNAITGNAKTKHRRVELQDTGGNFDCSECFESEYHGPRCSKRCMCNSCLIADNNAIAEAMASDPELPYSNTGIRLYLVLALNAEGFPELVTSRTTYNEAKQVSRALGPARKPTIQHVTIEV